MLYTVLIHIPHVNILSPPLARHPQVSLNGTTGEVIRGQQPLKPPEISGNLASFMEWVSGPFSATIRSCIIARCDVLGLMSVGCCHRALGINNEDYQCQIITALQMDSYYQADICSLHHPVLDL